MNKDREKLIEKAVIYFHDKSYEGHDTADIVSNIIDLIEANYEARVLEAVEKLNLLIPDINDVVEAIRGVKI